MFSAELAFEISFVTLLVTLLASGKIPPELGGLFCAVLLALTGHIPAHDAFSGFASGPVITMACLFVLSAALKETGVSSRVGLLMHKVTPRGETAAIVSVMIVAALFSAVMNNVIAAALLMPAVMFLATQRELAVSRLLMPLANGTLLGGMTTLIGTPPNLIASASLVQHGYEGFKMFSFTAVGIVATALGIYYVARKGRHKLPIVERARPVSSEMLEHFYGLTERIWRVKLPPKSMLVGKTLRLSRLGEQYGIRVIAIERANKERRLPAADELLEAEDTLVVSGDRSGLSAIVPEHAELLEDMELAAHGTKSGHAIVEVVVPPRSTYSGVQLSKVGLIERFGFHALSLWRDGAPRHVYLPANELEVGDALLLEGPVANLPKLFADDQLVCISELLPEARRAERWPFALGGLLLLVGLSFVGNIPVEISAIAGLLVALLGRALMMEEAYRAIEWRVVTLVATLIPIGGFLQHSELFKLVSETLVKVDQFQTQPWLLLCFLSVIASAISHLIEGTIAAILLAPLGIDLAAKLGLDPHPIVLAVALSCSIAFAAPYGNKVNFLVMNAGGYRYRDYVSVGGPLSFLMLLVVTILVPYYYGW